ncbi:cysteine-rich RLK (RECEPTOR-like protein kinase) 8 [Hibiscus trionum]|uniref:Cysteine-rich RLK (RECEPTOR-like protein kinase) 8 n=1 Tax=Hibiscus trionum TaxID=183268 RepID=A0A9W7MV87_HIBTR|nr:cysteine-rich RLK (RECEPTOR-like protein kinase) 8 [Hibiscus trionum]
MKEEIAALELNSTWSIVPLPIKKEPIGCKSIYQIKYKFSNEVKRFKAHLVAKRFKVRLVAKRYNQKEGVDFVETFSPVAKLTIIRLSYPWLPCLIDPYGK